MSLSLSICATGHVVAFRLTLVDPGDHSRVFLFELDASDPLVYSVPVCKPALPPNTLRDLLAALNRNSSSSSSSSADASEMDAFAVFVKRMREAFARLVEGEARERQAQAHGHGHGVRQ